MEITWCPLKRSSCQYDSQGNLVTDCFKDSSFLSAYTLKLDMHIKTNGVKDWRYIKSCQAEVLETYTLPTMVNETLWMRQEDRKWRPAALQLLWLLVLAFVGAILLLRYCRNDRCQVQRL
jgi:hypothetical protein